MDFWIAVVIFVIGLYIGFGLAAVFKVGNKEPPNLKGGKYGKRMD